MARDLAYTGIIFDLDGTLLDTSPGVFESVRYAAEALGYLEPSAEELPSFIGPPLSTSFTRTYGVDRAEADRLIAAFRECYAAGALFDARLYEGVMELFQELCERGCRLAIATSKAEVFARRIATHFGLDSYLTLIKGPDLANNLSKADLVRLCAEELGGTCLMVGDTAFDAAGAEEAGVAFCGVTYGFGDAAEMAAYPHVALVGRALDVLSVVLAEEVA